MQDGVGDWRGFLTLPIPPATLNARNPHSTRNSTVQCFLIYFQVKSTLPFAPVPTQSRKTLRPSDPTTRTKQPSSAPRYVNISPVLNSFRIPPVTMEVYYPSVIPLCALCIALFLVTSFVINGLAPLCVSLPSFFTPRPLFSITSSLFLQNTRGGGTFANPPLRISNIQTLFSRPVCRAVTDPHPSPESFLGALGASACPDRVGVANPVFVRPLFSQPYESLFSQLPCFHIHTNPPGVCPQTVGLRGNFRTTHYPLLTFRPRMIAYETC